MVPIEYCGLTKGAIKNYNSGREQCLCLAYSLLQFSDSFFDLSNSPFNISDSESGSYIDEKNTDDIIRNLSPYANKYCFIGSFIFFLIF